MAPDRLLLVLCLLPPRAPQAEHDIDVAEDNLNYCKRNSLVADEFQNIASAIHLDCEVNGGNEQVKQVMKGNRGEDNKHASLRVGVWESKLRQHIHYSPEGQSQESDEN